MRKWKLSDERGSLVGNGPFTPEELFAQPGVSRRSLVKAVDAGFFANFEYISEIPELVAMLPPEVPDVEDDDRPALAPAGEQPVRRAGAVVARAVESGTPQGLHVVYPAETLFESGPGYWRPNGVATILFVVGLVLMFLFGAGVLVWGYLGIAAMSSKADWRMREVMRAIYETRPK